MGFKAYDISSFENYIKNLKVSYNQVFGYYIEISKSNIDKAPDHYIRKQTLTNCERYITQELKELESKVLGAQERIVRLEYEIFDSVRKKAAEHRARRFCCVVIHNPDKFHEYTVSFLA